LLQERNNNLHHRLLNTEDQVKELNKIMMKFFAYSKIQTNNSAQPNQLALGSNEQTVTITEETVNMIQEPIRLPENVDNVSPQHSQPSRLS
jgi:hypothetical protein